MHVPFLDDMVTVCALVVLGAVVGIWLVSKGIDLMID